MVARSFSSVFESTTLSRLTKDDLAFLYKKKALSNESSWVKNRAEEPSFRRVLDQVSLKRPAELIQARIADTDAIRRLARSGEIHTLDRPKLGQAVWRALYKLDPGYSAEKLVESLQGS